MTCKPRNFSCETWIASVQAISKLLFFFNEELLLGGGVKCSCGCVVGSVFFIF